MPLRIGIIGAGIVGGSLKKWFEQHTDHDVKVYDPGLGRTDDLSSCQFCFIAVPVPTKSFKQDLTVLEESITRCPKGAVIFVRSSVLPGTCDELAKKYDRIICAMPEFLTERTAYNDTEALGILCGLPDSHLTIMLPLMSIFPSKKLTIVKNAEAEMAKYVHNCYGALKVTYFNGIYNLCKKGGLDYDRVLEAASLTPFIGPYHTQVPGPDGLLGFGGKCFPKDLAAFVGHLDGHNLSALLMPAIALNRVYRGENQFSNVEKQNELTEKTS